MAEGAILDGGFIDRSRFRTSFDESSYIRRQVRPAPNRSPRPIKSSLDVPRSVERTPSPSVKRKLANLAVPAVAMSAPTASISVPISRQDDKPNRKQALRFNLELLNTDKIKQFRLKHIKPSVLNFVNSKTRIQLALLALAAVMVLSGMYLSFIGLKSDQAVHAQAVKLTQEANKAGASTTAGGNSSSPALSTIKPSKAAVAAYAVAPNYPKYLKIPSIGVDSIVGQTGLLASGALGTPSNVYYTDWYTGSAEPGQPGATLIDGHVSSWTAKGVFFDLHLLKAGDPIQIVKGDNSVVNYQVVQTQVYSSSNVDMQAAITPVVPGVSGLNLITCTGQVIKGTSEFNERIIVFAKQV
jgi:LPXTG-site transpeptidase (sortase) family protein